MSDNPRLLVVEARFYDDLSDALLSGARKVIDEAGASCDVVTVMGALEIPAAIAMAEEAARDGGKRYDGYVALGVVIRGETYHFDIVANESSRALMDMTINGPNGSALAIGNGIMTTENGDQAWARCDPARLDKGGFAARAALTMIELRKKLGA